MLIKPMIILFIIASPLLAMENNPKEETRPLQLDYDSPTTGFNPRKASQTCIQGSVGALGCLLAALGLYTQDPCLITLCCLPCCPTGSYCCFDCNRSLCCPQSQSCKKCSLEGLW